MIRVNSLQVDSRLLPLSLQANAGEVWHVIGPNGCGKSTLLAALAGMIPFSGSVQVDGLDVSQASLSELARHRAYLAQNDKPSFQLHVFQYLALSVPANVALERSEVASEIDQISRLLNIDDKLHRSIHQLSGGEWQRVRLAGSCLQVSPVLNPSARLLIWDEPSAPLDIAQESLLYRLIGRMAGQGLTVIMANHDLNRTLRHADQVLLLSRGVLYRAGSAEEVLTQEVLQSVFGTSIRRVELEGHPHLLFD
ncbi:vitamin B12 ABC transporter ATP-binding protein BtuD [Vibrio cholerae]|uniref:vitamin B12 ABC transporter ATP-binding protein BtuD n=1 Tax=Vibrio cholerae TaxID=666 RepID=UPI0011F1F226|nr:vitamin B12 ABC transporter ATP-binding protein BtuD [Vibrio cholerae]QEO41556.1 vitamin B12 ABC transporter ATP-binding protein BtuD [Vibrio cholerae]